MPMPVIGLLHPGAMGASVGGALHARGHRVLWCARGRSAATARRAAQAGLSAVDGMADLLSGSDLILSICPPHAASQVADSAKGFTGVFVEANAISPGTAEQIGERLAADGATVVDGCILGPPPGAPDEPSYYRLFFAGSGAAQVAALFDGTPYRATVIDGPVGAASAMKMAWSSWVKGTAALLLTTRRLAHAYRAEEALLAAWRDAIPELAARSQEVDHLLATKGWRWPGEMEQLAAAAETVGLPPHIYQGAAEIFRLGRTDIEDSSER
jgi:3-hydroxyisobutyrate dehydrogenase-like beta-hydroxyacid dehydrogenase